MIALWLACVPTDVTNRPDSTGSTDHPPTTSSRELGTVRLADAGSAAGIGAAGTVIGGVLEAADLDGDGAPELLIGIPGSGRMAIGPPVADGLPAGASVGSVADEHGASVAVGDWDRDGRVDWWVGAPGGMGAVVAGTGVPVGDAVATVSIQGLGERFGASVAVLEDVDGDGQGELLVGAPDCGAGCGLGSAYLISDPLQPDLANALRWLGSAGAGTGSNVASLGDLNGDGISDLGIGSPGQTAGAALSGRADVFYGPLAGSVAPIPDLALATEEAGDRVGHVIASGGDDDGDGYGSVVVSAPGALDARGKLFTLRAPLRDAFLQVADGRVEGDKEGDGLADSVDSGDLDDDGLSDLVIGVRSADAGGSDAGAVYVWYGPMIGLKPAASADWVIQGDVAGDGLGSAVAAGLGTAGGDPLWAASWQGTGLGAQTGVGAVHLVAGALD